MVRFQFKNCFQRFSLGARIGSAFDCTLHLWHGDTRTCYWRCSRFTAIPITSDLVRSHQTTWYAIRSSSASSPLSRWALAGWRSERRRLHTQTQMPTSIALNSVSRAAIDDRLFRASEHYSPAVLASVSVRRTHTRTHNWNGKQIKRTCLGKSAKVIAKVVRQRAPQLHAFAAKWSSVGKTEVDGNSSVSQTHLHHQSLELVANRIPIRCWP